MDFSQYNAIVGYGIGQDYQEQKQRLRGKITFDYLADRKWKTSDIKVYDNIPIIRLDELKWLKRVLIVLFPHYESIRNDICRELKEINADIYYIGELFPRVSRINGRQLFDLLPRTEYRDEFDNCIMFDDTISFNINITMKGSNNLIKIGRYVKTDSLHILCGTNGRCLIGDNCSIRGAKFYISQATLQLGENCLLSTGIRIRTHDAHHIFDKITCKRINFAQDVVVGNKVWLGCDAVLLSGAHIGTGSIVGERAVTSSCFKENVIIAGCPARIVRENVCWSSDLTACFDHSNLEECADQTAFQYFEED